MPNWCSNDLCVVGPEEAVAAFVAAVAPLPGEESHGETALSFQRIDPIPAALLADQFTEEAKAANKAEYGFETWYEARQFRWNSKWDVSATLLEQTRLGELAVARYRFDSPWSPPIAGLLTASRQHSEATLRLLWREPGMDCGEYTVISGGEQRYAVNVAPSEATTEVIVDAAGAPVQVQVPHERWEDAPAPVPGDLAATVRSVLVDMAEQGPGGQVLITCWEGALPVAVPAALAGTGMDVEDARAVLTVSLPQAERVRVMVERDGAEAWFADQWDDWEYLTPWLPRALAEQVDSLVGRVPGRALRVLLACVRNVSPAEVEDLTDRVLDAGVDEAAAVRLLAQMSPEVPEGDADLLTVLTGSLLPSRDGQGAAARG